MERLFPGRQAPVFYEACLDSTNRLLKEWAVQGAAHGTVLIAGRQTGGRGRLGRSFASPEGGLYLSVLFRPACSLEQAASLSALAALAVCRAVRDAAGVAPGIKWPNDVVLNGKKLCGILAESVLGSDGARLIVGIGVNGNLRLEDFPEDLRQTACSLLSETGKPVDLRALEERLIREMDALYAAWEADSLSLLKEYRGLCLTCGRDVRILRDGESRPAKALSVNGDYSLRVAWPDGREEDVRFGEVSVRGLLGYV